jgi:hypothetical protein
MSARRSHPLPSPSRKGEGVASSGWRYPAAATGGHLPPWGAAATAFEDPHG